MNEQSSTQRPREMRFTAFVAKLAVATGFFYGYRVVVTDGKLVDNRPRSSGTVETTSGTPGEVSPEMTFDFRVELDRLVTRVEQHPLTEVLSYDVGAPADPKAVRAVESEFGKTIPRSVLDLYGQLNGATFTWRFRKDLDDAHHGRIIDQFAPFTSAPENVFALAGSIDLIPIEDALLDEDYTLPQIEEENGEFLFDGLTYSDNGFCDLIRVFDAVSEGSAMAFVTRPDVEAWKLMWLTDDWLVYDSSRTTWLEDYLRTTIATWGLITARDALFIKYEGHLEKPVLFDQNAVSSLVPPTMAER